jgi:hypothetical protein
MPASTPGFCQTVVLLPHLHGTVPFGSCPFWIPPPVVHWSQAVVAFLTGGVPESSFVDNQGCQQKHPQPVFPQLQTYQISNLTLSSGMVLVKKAAPTVEACEEAHTACHDPRAPPRSCSGIYAVGHQLELALQPRFWAALQTQTRGLPGSRRTGP